MYSHFTRYFRIMKIQCSSIKSTQASLKIHRNQTRKNSSYQLYIIIMHTFKNYKLSEDPISLHRDCTPKRESTRIVYAELNRYRWLRKLTILRTNLS